MAAKRIIDYYAVLAIPPQADLMGVENSYARLSDEFASRAELDDTSRDALMRLNEAYTVLSRPDLRREYDRMYFSREIAVAQEAAAIDARHRRVLGNVIVGALLFVVTVQAAVLVYVGRDFVADVAGVVLGPLVPDSAG